MDQKLFDATFTFKDHQKIMDLCADDIDISTIAEFPGLPDVVLEAENISNFIGKLLHNLKLAFLFPEYGSK